MKIFEALYYVKLYNILQEQVDGRPESNHYVNILFVILFLNMGELTCEMFAVTHLNANWVAPHVFLFIFLIIWENAGVDGSPL